MLNIVFLGSFLDANATNRTDIFEIAQNIARLLSVYRVKSMRFLRSTI
jgi:ABC-type transporter Mla subunit MlaD